MHIGAGPRNSLERKKGTVLSITSHIQAGVQVNQVCGALSKGGGSTDGNVGSTFFSGTTLPAVSEYIDEKYKTDISTLHKNLSTALRVIWSTDEVDVNLVDNLLKETSLLLARKFN